MLNKIIAFILFVILLPIFFLVSLIILIDDSFPVFFTQKRVGINKSIFYIIKLKDDHGLGVNQLVKTEDKDKMINFVEDPEDINKPN